MSNLLKLFKDSSAFYGSNAIFIEELYEDYLEDPDSVEESWRNKFNKLHNGSVHDIPHSPVVKQFAKLAKTSPGRIEALQGITEDSIRKQSAVARLINHYRFSGHQIATNNPLGNEGKYAPDLDISYYGLTEPDMNTIFDTGTLYGADRLPLREIISTLQEIYCGNIGSEYMHIIDSNIKRWIKNRLESSRTNLQIATEKKIWLLKLLTASEGIEKFLHRKYVGQKRFSLEGGESLIPLLDEVIQRGGGQGAKEIVIGMAHRGRLNVLINILGKSPATLFGEFEGSMSEMAGVNSGDVKYHMGFSSNVATPGGPVHLTLAFNPSHLEIINPVVGGSVKARQDRYEQDNQNTVIPILIHGDAAFSGQGVVMEALNMSQTRAYSTGGTVHIVINNQIGFTTDEPEDCRSTNYCTDVAHMIQAPVFHVNGDDPEAVLFTAQLALDYRNKFNKDVVIDLVCYRRHGHNEADEPATTQPLMYQTIRNHDTSRKIYADKLIAEEVISDEQSIAMERDYQNLLEEGKVVSRPVLGDSIYFFTTQWKKYFSQNWETPCNTAISMERLRYCSDRLQCLPTGFELHSRVSKIMENRRKMAAGALPLDWGFAENLAYASLLLDGRNIRLTGQDIGRGTFFHRHAILHNQINGESHIPLAHLDEKQGRTQIYNSLLSEAGVLGFEYGYSSTDPETLVIWEAQFGDFANGAQVVIDQFISSGESKWGRLCGLVMLLPHGYEGQGPEHSSARLERYLQLCAEQNIQVCTPTTPAQQFHLLRRQLLRTYRKPLVIMSPKSLLRHKLAVSTLEDMTNGKFEPVLGEVDEIKAKNVTRVVLCCGKVFYDLIEARRHDQLEHVAIIRLEQLYPFPVDQLSEELDKYNKTTELIWCQEEPKNQGAWYQIRHRIVEYINPKVELLYSGRLPSSAPAVGTFTTHIEQQKQLVQTALHGQTNMGNNQ